jgi:tRNA A-37 threonylcarbamoyl transferase component Bud32
MLNAGTVLNNTYRMIKLLGKGAMGNVYLVEKIEDDSKFVVKELLFSSETAIDPSTAREIFFRESEFMAKFNHQGLPKMFGTFTQNDRDYIVMEYINGKTLEEIINTSKKPVPVNKAIKWVIELAVILDYLHNSFHTPVVYRDLKPSNIIITPEGTPWLVDFGIARYYNPDKDTDTFSYGSPGYAAPEQYRGKGQTTPQSDIFGLGVILFQMLTKYDPSVKPFTWPPMQKLNPSISEELENIVRRALELEPLKRYISMKDFRETLEKHLKIDKPAPGRVPEPLPFIENVKMMILMFLFMFAPSILVSLVFDNIFADGREIIYYFGCQIIFIIIIYVLYMVGVFGSSGSICLQGEFLTLNLIAAVLIAIITPSYNTAKHMHLLDGCKVNLKNMGIHLEMYAQTNDGCYPPTLDKILVKSGKFRPVIREIPLCPGRQDRIKNFSKFKNDMSPHYLYTVSEKLDNFTLQCNTQKIHLKSRKVSRRGCWPQYIPGEGLLSGPGSRAGKSGLK